MRAPLGPLAADAQRGACRTIRMREREHVTGGGLCRPYLLSLSLQVSQRRLSPPSARDSPDENAPPAVLIRAPMDRHCFREDRAVHLRHDARPSLARFCALARRRTRLSRFAPTPRCAHGSRLSVADAPVMIVDSREALTAPLAERLTFGIYVMAPAVPSLYFRGCIKNARTSRSTSASFVRNM